MNEENTFLEELEDTLEESASAEAGESSTPVEDFAFWLKDLANCASFRGNIVFLDRSGANVMAADTSEAISSKGKCRDMAQTCIDKVIHEARQKIDVRTSISGSGSFCQEFRQRFDRRLDALREKLEVLRTPENTAVVDELEDYLTASEIHKKAKEICAELSSRYQLQAASAYYNAISYDVWDPSDYEEGLAKLFAKGFVRHGFNCYKAIRYIETDAQASLDGFQTAFNEQMQDEILERIVEPVQRLLPKLRDSAVRRSA